MLSHAIPSTDRASAPSPPSVEARPAQARSRVEGPRGGSFSLPFHPSLRRQGADLDSGRVPPGSGKGRLCGRLRLSVAGCAGARLRRPRAACGDRRAAGDDAALFADSRRLCDGASRHERDPAHGRGGPRDARRAAQDGAQPQRRGGVRRAGAQVPDLGADALSDASRRGAHARSPFARGTRRVRAGGGVVGMSHVPVLLEEAMEALKPRPGGLYVDATFGAGGYTRALLDRGANVVALDRDPAAIRGGADLVSASGGRLRLIEARFGDLGAVAQALGLEKADGIVFDIGVSSMQLDEAERGFSLRFDAPLDMRMEGKGRSAADILREEDEATIADILFHFGEERAARRIARAIVADRKTAPYVRTAALANMVARVAPARRGELTHPATRTFQALRIAVNDELGEL